MYSSRHEPNVIIVAKIINYFRKTVITTVITADTQCEYVVTNRNYDGDDITFATIITFCTVPVTPWFVAMHVGSLLLHIYTSCICSCEGLLKVQKADKRATPLDGDKSAST